MEEIIKLCLLLIKILMTEKISETNKKKLFSSIEDTISSLNKVETKDVMAHIILSSFSKTLTEIIKK